MSDSIHLDSRVGVLLSVMMMMMMMTIRPLAVYLHLHTSPLHHRHCGSNRPMGNSNWVKSVALKAIGDQGSSLFGLMGWDIDPAVTSAGKQIKPTMLRDKLPYLKLK